jgi:predicted dehydrogenase/threonine dehydrogenase-like Zn-dependent dehydrogenase
MSSKKEAVMKQVIIRDGRAEVDEVPAPRGEAGGVLVRVEHSCISIGTEMSELRASGTPIWKRALAQPEKAMSVLRNVQVQGVARTVGLVRGRLSAGKPTGYSAAGVVLEVGAGVSDLRRGDRVACAGAQCAYHAEIIQVPRQLCVRIPAGLDTSAASTVAVGAIALQGVRRAAVTLGETVVVIGLGLLGQLTSQILRANGCRVIGIDANGKRVDQALGFGMDVGLDPSTGDIVEQVMRVTDGIGADAVIITAATRSDGVVARAFRICRRKGRVVLVGDVGLKLNRADFYKKEIDFLISTSYGPGRYDKRYEEEGVDYPLGYVRWTENRNFEAYLRLLANGSVNIAQMIEATYPIERASEAYEALGSTGAKPLIVLLRYPAESSARPVRTVANPAVKSARSGALGIAVVGAGWFAKNMHLPNLRDLSDRFHIRALVTRSSHNATATARQFGAAYASTDYRQILQDPAVDAVLIATGPNLHAEITLAALAAGKHVLVEKPMVLHRAELEEIRSFYDAGAGTALPLLLTGFNRRFSPFLRRIHELTRARSNPMIINYRMNAGYIAPLDQSAEENGSRNISEACHIYDVFTFLTNSRVVDVAVQTIDPRTDYYVRSDNFIATMRFEDGSIATLTYTALGSKEYPKEKMEVYSDGAVFELDDYRSLRIAGQRGAGVQKRKADKGQKDELIAFANAIRAGGEWPIPLWQQIQATEIAFQVEEQLSK